MLVDVNFDLRSDSGGRDPDSASATLRRYHKLLWEKHLPDGRFLAMREDPKGYLIAQVNEIEIRLSSDTISNSMSAHKAMAHLLDFVSKELNKDVKDLGSTIGGRLVFPSAMKKGSKTVNVSRGFHPQIRDRFDLTLECIRLFYRGEGSPLRKTLENYSDFFWLFGGFNGYIDFFHLEDLVDGNQVVSLTGASSHFDSAPQPRSASEYVNYLTNTASFLRSRNTRIAALAR